MWGCPLRAPKKENFCSSSEQPKRNKCRNSLGCRGGVYPRSLREAKCERAEALAGIWKQRRIGSYQVPMAKQGYCLYLPVEKALQHWGAGLFFFTLEDALLLCLPCQMTVNSMRTWLRITGSTGASFETSLLSVSAYLCKQCALNSAIICVTLMSLHLKCLLLLLCFPHVKFHTFAPLSFLSDLLLGLKKKKKKNCCAFSILTK